VYCLERVRYLEGRPIAYTKKVIKSEFFPQLLSCDFLSSLTEIYNKKFGVVYQKTRYKISSTSLTGYVAQMLRATSGTPAMFVERINYDTLGRLVDCDIEYWRHDAICIESIAELV
jgi:DNA-binding GntR family transcriptional regulator